jgi:cysteine desulfurase
MIYLDNHATTPCDPRVVQAMLPWFTSRFGNAGSVEHALGRQAAEAVEDARGHVARLIGATASEIIFTSGATVRTGARGRAPPHRHPRHRASRRS